MAQIPGWDLEEVAAREDAFVALVDKSIAFVVNKVTMQATDVITAAAPPPVEEPPPTPPPPPLLPLEVMGSIPVLWAGQVTAELLPFLGYTFTASAAAVAASIIEAYPNYALPPVSDVFAEEYLASAANRLVGIGDAVWATMRQELVTGFSEGESIPELAARLQLVAGITEPRAHVIARTEVISASNIGSITQAKISGLVGTKSWEATNDERTRCTHRAADGQTVDLNGKFQLGGLGADVCGDAAASYLDVPGDPTGPPGEVIQCRCTIIYDLDLPEEEPVVTAAAQVHTGAMIALRMTEPDARVLEIPGYEDADELHTTFLYLGEAASFDDEARENILGLIAGIAGEYDPITTSAFAVNVFNPHKTDTETALVLGIEGGTSGIVELKNLIDEVITSEYSIAEQHTPWVPHVTIAYTDDMTLMAQLMERLGPITYDRLRVAFAGDVYDYPLRQVVTASANDFDESKVKRDKKGQFAKKDELPDVDVDSPDVALIKKGDFSKLKKISGAKGSNPGGVFEAPDGTRWYVKAQKSKAHAENERLASTLYRETGIDVPEVIVGSGVAEFVDGVSLTATQILPDAKSDLGAKLLNDPDYVNKIREGFAVDAWLANWDVAGLSLDNIVTDKDGKPQRIDVGGALKYRAQGSPKGDLFGTSVNEWDTLRGPKAPQASKIFGGMSKDQLQASAKRVEAITPERIKELVSDKALAEKLIARRADLLKRVAQETGTPAAAPPPSPTPTPTPTPILPSVSKLTNAVIYGKYNEGDTIATSTDGKTRLKYEGNKIVEYENIDGDWKVVKAHTKGGAYKDVNSLGKSWYMGEGPATAPDPTPVPTPSAAAPVIDEPDPPAAPNATTVGAPVVATPAGVWNALESYIPGEVALLGLSNDGKPSVRFLVKTGSDDKNELMAQMLMSDGSWKDVLPVSSAGQIEQILKSKSNYSWSLASPGGTLNDLPASTTPMTPDPSTTTYTAKSINSLWSIIPSMPLGTVLWTSTWKDTGALQGRVVVKEAAYGNDKIAAFEFWDNVDGKFKYSHSIPSAAGLNAAYTDAQLDIKLADNVKIDPNVPISGASASSAPLKNFADVWLKRDQYPVGTIFAEGKFLGKTNVRVISTKSSTNSTIFQLQLQADNGQWTYGTKYLTQSQLEALHYNDDFKFTMTAPKPADPNGPAPYVPTPTPPATGLPGTPSPGVPPAMTSAHEKTIKEMFTKAGVKWHSASNTMLEAVKHAQNAFPQYSVKQILDLMDTTTKTSTSPKPFTDKIKKYLGTKSGKSQGIYLWGGYATLLSSLKGAATNANAATPSTTSHSYTFGAPLPAGLEKFQVVSPTAAAAMQKAMAGKYGAWKPNEKEALTTYTSGSYTAINKCLRGLASCPDWVLKTIDNASKGMRPLTKSVKTFRGAGWGAFGLSEGYAVPTAENIDKMLAKVGTTIREPGFLSTSVNPNKSFGGPIRIEIFAPEGTPAAYVKSISLHPNEDELLLEHNLKYKIVEVIQQPGSYPAVLVRLEVVVP